MVIYNEDEDQNVKTFEQSEKKSTIKRVVLEIEVEKYSPIIKNI